MANRFLLVHEGKLIEINNPDEYYATELIADENTNVPRLMNNRHTNNIEFNSEDDILKAIFEIDEKIKGQLRQKPARQNKQKIKILEEKKSQLENLI